MHCRLGVGVVQHGGLGAKRARRGLVVAGGVVGTTKPGMTRQGAWNVEGLGAAVVDDVGAGVEVDDHHGSGDVAEVACPAVRRVAWRLTQAVGAGAGRGDVATDGGEDRSPDVVTMSALGGAEVERGTGRCGSGRGRRGTPETMSRRRGGLGCRPSPDVAWHNIGARCCVGARAQWCRTPVMALSSCPGVTRLPG